MSLVRVDLLYMSVSGGMLILVVLLLRKLFRGRVSGRVFPILWCIVLLRLFLPFSVSSPVSVYPLPGGMTLAAAGKAGGYYGNGGYLGSAGSSGAAGSLGGSENLGAAGYPDSDNVGAAGSPDATGNSVQGGYSGGATDPGTGTDSMALLGSYLKTVGKIAETLRPVGMGGTLVCAAVFLAMYLSCLRLFSTSIPVENPYVKRWVRENRLRRQISVRQSVRVASPLTYGIFRPVILLPKSLEWEDERKLAYILEHEMVHIRRLDGGLKLAMAAALCLHWLNPLVWVMYVLLNRDVELACDEKVLRIYGAGARKGYALTLIGMEERKFPSVLLLNGFGKNAVEERVGAIMRYKRKKGILAVSAALLMFTVAFLFATSVRAGERNVNTEVPAEEPETDSTVMDPPYPADGSLSQGNAGQDTEGLPSGQRNSGVSQAPVGTDAAGVQPERGSVTGSGEGPELFSGMSYAAEEYDLNYMLEGMEEKVPAWLVYGQGYCLLVPKEDWVMSAPEEWVNEINDSVVFRVVHFSGEDSEFAGLDRDQIAQDYMARGYQSQYKEYQLYQEKDGIIDVVELRSNVDDVWGLCYTYPSEAEEGFGSRLRAMAQYFGIVPAGGDENPVDPMWQVEQNVVREVTLQILELCLENPQALSPYLSVSFDEEDLDILGLLTECSSEELSLRQNISSNTVIASVPVRTTESEDSVDYLTIGLVKEQGGWKIAFMGLEK